MAKYKALLALLALAPACVHAAPDHTVTQQTIDGWKQTQSNWGRWGKDDQKGTLNLITPEVRKRAAALVQTGTVISLSREIVPQHVAGETPAVPGPCVDAPRIARGFSEIFRRSASSVVCQAS